MNERSFIKDHQTKERIVQASLAVFAEKGYHATTIQEIAHRAGIAVGTIYIYFSNKSDLFRTLIQYVLESIQSSIQERNRQELEPWRRLCNVFEVSLDLLVQNGDLFRMIRHLLAEGGSEDGKLIAWGWEAAEGLKQDLCALNPTLPPKSAHVSAQILITFLFSVSTGFIVGQLELEDLETREILIQNYRALLKQVLESPVNIVQEGAKI